MPRWSWCQDPRPRRVGKVPGRAMRDLPSPGTTRSTRSRDWRRPSQSSSRERWPLLAGRGRGRLAGHGVQHALADGDHGRLLLGPLDAVQVEASMQFAFGSSAAQHWSAFVQTEQSPAGAPPAPPVPVLPPAPVVPPVPVVRRHPGDGITAGRCGRAVHRQALLDRAGDGRRIGALARCDRVAHFFLHDRQRLLPPRCQRPACTPAPCRRPSRTGPTLLVPLLLPRSPAWCPANSASEATTPTINAVSFLDIFAISSVVESGADVARR